ncbi:hypothetical protein [uncultured Hyphomicrobium sp.]|uniref:hypothetical protein n=1 Tax=uncultured Hyphomicrobium sp. TaxID=194373 RepID=UPI0025EAB75B|nr:hypothetical protein [uncultured Hyphomicrobium sp.]
MFKQYAIALCAFAILSSAGSYGAFAYTEEEIGKAKQFIEEKFTPEKKALLDELAKKAGKSPEELFLDISKIGGGNFLGENPDDPGDSDDEPPPSGTKKDSDSSGGSGEKK